MDAKPFKIVLLGDAAVGKSSLVIRFVEGQFTEYQQSTVGAAYLTKTVSVNDKNIKLEIWDTAGQERYRSLAPMYYRGALGAIVVFDVTNPDSLGAAGSWIAELRERGEANMVIAVAGNKADMQSSKAVAPGDVDDLMKQNGIELYLDTSAKTGQNVDVLFESLARSYVEMSKRLGLDDDDNDALVLGGPKTKGGCCK